MSEGANQSVGLTKGVSQVRASAVPKTRSPNYPALTIEHAIRRARELLREVGRVPTSEDVIAGIWGLSAKSSTFRLSIAALRSFGLLVEQPGAKGDLVKLSNLALDILEDYPPGSAQQREAIQKAALAPRVHGTLYGRYGPTLPANAEVRRYLIREHEPPFNDNTVGDFIAKYKATIAFAGFGESATIEDEAGDEEDDPTPGVSVGDLVQWTSAGTDMFPDPRPVLGLSEDREFAFVPGTKAGLPVSQLTVVSRAMPGTEPQGSPPLNPFVNAPLASSKSEPEPRAVPTGFKEDAYDLPEGRAVFRWPERLDPAGVEELQDWFALIIRKMRRTCSQPPKKAGQQGDGPQD